MQRSKKYLYSMTSSAREEARARTRIFSVGDRPPILASPISRRRDPDILMPIQPRVCGLLPQILWHRRLGGLRGVPGRTRTSSRTVIARSARSKDIAAAHFPLDLPPKM